MVWSEKPPAGRQMSVLQGHVTLPEIIMRIRAWHDSVMQ